MSSSTLALEQRQAGSKYARALRRAGKVPGTLYGHDAAPLPVAVEAKAFAELLRTGAGHHLMTIMIDGKNADSVLLRSVQRDPVTQAILHADFQRVGSDEAIRASVPLNLIGVAPGVKNEGGVLDTLLHEIEVSGPASQLPEHLDYDISHLQLQAVVHAGEITLPKGFTLVTNTDSVVLTLEPPRTQALVDELSPEAAPAPTS